MTARITALGMRSWYMVFCFKQKTAYEMRISDWSSDVCSSDLTVVGGEDVGPSCVRKGPRLISDELVRAARQENVGRALCEGEQPLLRSEERRVGKECVSTCRSRCSTDN